MNRISPPIKKIEKTKKASKVFIQRTLTGLLAPPSSPTPPPDSRPLAPAVGRTSMGKGSWLEESVLPVLIGAPDFITQKFHDL